ncbi:50S ribosomal protein L3 [Candidatus Pacearchaeota archaeon]|nr:50S ribosomal protein L3 [Candidatus Pacearchaeota archaeon]
MPKRKSPRKGSLQFWPRKRARKIVPSVNWKAINSSDSVLKGFLCYKAGMASAKVTDNTADSMTKGRQITLPVTILECPKMKIFSVRFYKNKQVATEILGKNLDKELKKSVKIPKKQKDLDLIKIGDYDGISVIVYSQIKKTGIKKKPDLTEIGLSDNLSLEEKFNFIKENIDKELSITDFFSQGDLVDFRGLTKGKGFSGPVKRFGITLKNHKSEKGVRRPGSIGPWHPARVTFRAPQAGQLGFFTRAIYNNKIIDIGSASKDEKEGDNKILKTIKNYGNIKTDYLIVKGSVQGPAKRVLLATAPLRETKKTKKRDYELLEVLR